MFKSLKQSIYRNTYYKSQQMDQKVWNSIDLQPDCALRSKLREPLSRVLFYGLVDDLWNTLKETQLNSPFSSWLPPEPPAEPQHTDASAQSLEESG